MNDILHATEPAVPPALALPSNSDIYYKIGGLEAKLDAHLTAIITTQTAVSLTLKDHDARIDILETSRARTAGMFAWVIPLASVGLSIAAAWVTRVLHV